MNKQTTNTLPSLSYFDYPGQRFSVDFTTAFQKIWGNFITANNPSISNAIANGVSSNNSASANGASEWPIYTIAAPYQVDLNTTCPDPVGGQCLSPNAVNTFRVVDAYTWEGGRGVRCDFWRSVGEVVPE
jgi:hypothetical protein